MGKLLQVNNVGRLYNNNIFVMVRPNISLSIRYLRVLSKASEDTRQTFSLSPHRANSGSATVVCGYGSSAWLRLPTEPSNSPRPVWCDMQKLANMKRLLVLEAAGGRHAALRQWLRTRMTSVDPFLPGFLTLQMDTVRWGMGCGASARAGVMETPD